MSHQRSFFKEIQISSQNNHFRDLRSKRDYPWDSKLIRFWKFKDITLLQELWYWKLPRYWLNMTNPAETLSILFRGSLNHIWTPWYHTRYLNQCPRLLCWCTRRWWLPQYWHLPLLMHQQSNQHSRYWHHLLGRQCYLCYWCQLKQSLILP